MSNIYSYLFLSYLKKKKTKLTFSSKPYLKLGIQNITL